MSPVITVPKRLDVIFFQHLRRVFHIFRLFSQNGITHPGLLCRNGVECRFTLFDHRKHANDAGQQPEGFHNTYDDKGICAYRVKQEADEAGEKSVVETYKIGGFQCFYIVFCQFNN